MGYINEELAHNLLHGPLVHKVLLLELGTGAVEKCPKHSPIIAADAGAETVHPKETAEKHERASCAYFPLRAGAENAPLLVELWEDRTSAAAAPPLRDNRVLCPVLTPQRSGG